MSCPLCGGSCDETRRFGLLVWGCSRVPPGCVYIDDQFEKGPRGRLLTEKDLRASREDEGRKGD